VGSVGVQREMMNFLVWLEQLSFSTWVREGGSLWGYPFILFLHTMGLAIVVGVSAAVDLRLLGVGSSMPLAPLERFFPIMWFGFWINAVSGTILLMADATTKLTNWVFYVKMTFIALALWNVWVIRRRAFKVPQVSDKTLPGNAKLLAAISLFLWTMAITSGRLMAYLGPVSGLQGVENHVGK
jgi:hypothetical protein